ncbi:MAG TPA: hypothetical protein VI685_07865 [Candidatus Angelobacter sp.]
MQILLRMKRVAQLIFDGEIYSLARIAAQNRLKKTYAPGPQVEPAKQKKAKAVNGK